MSAGRENIELLAGRLSLEPTPRDLEDAVNLLFALAAQIEGLERVIRDFLLQWERHSSEQDDFVVDAVFGLRAALAQSEDSE